MKLKQVLNRGLPKLPATLGALSLSMISKRGTSRCWEADRHTSCMRSASPSKEPSGTSAKLHRRGSDCEKHPTVPEVERTGPVVPRRSNATPKTRSSTGWSVPPAVPFSACRRRVSAHAEARGEKTVRPLRPAPERSTATRAGGISNSTVPHGLLALGEAGEAPLWEVRGG